MSSEVYAIGLIIALVVVYLIGRAEMSGRLRRPVIRDSEGNIVGVGEQPGGTQGQLSGRGNTLSKPLKLTDGLYRIDYQFDALTRVALVDASGDETLFIKRGEGMEMLTIAQTARYRFLVEPADEAAAWQLAYRPLRLYLR